MRHMDRMTKEESKVRESLYTGAAYGMIAWAVYGMVEYFFTALLPWIMNPSHAYMPVHRAFTVLLFVFYPLAGMILGGLAGLCHHVARPGRGGGIAPLATVTVVLAFVVNLLYIWMSGYYPGVNLLPSFAVSLVLLPALILAASGHRWRKRLGFLANPWTAALALLGILPWTVYVPFDSQSMTVKSAAALLYPLIVVLVSFIASKVRGTGGADSSHPLKTLACLVPLYVLVFGTGLFLEQTPLVAEGNTAASLRGSDKPNVILITMDTVRADHLSVYGYERDTTPSLRRLAEESVLYTNAISTSNMTLPSHASIFTGLYTRSHGAHHIFGSLTPGDDELARVARLSRVAPLAGEFTTLTEVLAEKGYLTMGVVANGGYLGHHYNINQGFQYYDYRAPVLFLGRLMGKVRPFYLRQTIHTLLSRFISTEDYHKTFPDAEEINEQVFPLLEKAREEDARFFLFINYMDAHAPYPPHPPFDTRFPGKDDSFTPVEFDRVEREVITLNREITDEERRHLLSQYDGGIAYEDFHIGRLISVLKETGLYDNSLIIVTSDHGEAFGERNFMQHGNSVYQNEVHVPLIIKYPGGDNARVVEEYVSGVDIMPTVLDVLGYEIPPGLQGVSLLRPELLKERNILSESFSARRNLRLHKRFYRIERAIFSGPMKFISSTYEGPQLYDLSRDPREEENLHSPGNEHSAELEAKLEQWLASVREESPPVGGAVTGKRANKEALDRLKALGYVQ